MPVAVLVQNKRGVHTTQNALEKTPQKFHTTPHFRAGPVQFSVDIGGLRRGTPTEFHAAVGFRGVFGGGSNGRGKELCLQDPLHQPVDRRPRWIARPV